MIPKIVHYIWFGGNSYSERSSIVLIAGISICQIMNLCYGTKKHLM